MSPATSTHPLHPSLRSEPASTGADRTSWLHWMLPAFALALWLLAIRHLAPNWNHNEQYQFGWLVPLLAAYLIKVRFERLPARSATPPAWMVHTAVLLLALGSVLIMPIREANLDWRFVEWCLSGLAITATLVCFWQLGGTRWARHFAFPALFFLIAVPLPRNLETPWMDRLMLNNAHLSVEMLSWFGIEAMAQGNLIRLPSCTLGVDEACSGIRSLQSTLMLSLFLGEMLALTWVRRLLLLGAGLGWALVTNVGRTTFLGSIAARDGLAAVDQWHDVAGYSVLAGCAITVGATAWLLHRLPSLRRRPHTASTSAPLSGLTAAFQPVAFAGLAGLVLVVLGLGANKLWFDHHERSLTRVADWEFVLPEQQPGFREEAIPPRTRRTLNFDEGYSGRWIGSANDRWQGYYFRWLPSHNSAQSTRVHDPRSCLGSVGMEFVSTLPRVPVESGEVSLLFDAFHFRDGPHDLYVFNCLAEDVRTASGLRRAPEANSPRERLAAALAGRRQAGQRRVELAVWNAPDATTATTRFQALMTAQLRVTPPPR